MISKRDSILSVISLGLGSLLSISSTVLLAKYLTSDSYGTYLAIMSFSAVMCSLSLLGIGDLILKCNSNDSAQKNLVINTFIIQYFLFNIITILIILLFNVNSLALCVTSTLPLIQLISPIFKSLQRISISNILSSSTWPVAVGLALLYLNIITETEQIDEYKELIYLSSISIFILSISLLIYLRNINYFVKFKIDIKITQKLLTKIKESIEIGLLSFIYTATMNTDIIIMDFFERSNEISNYKISSLVMILMLIPHVAINNIVGSRVSTLIEDKNSLQIATLLRRSSALQISIGILSALFLFYSYEITIKFIFDNKYSIDKITFLSFLLIPFFYYWNGPSVIVLVLSNKQNSLSKIYLKVFILNILFNLLLQKFYGGSGAAISSVISNFLLIYLTKRISSAHLTELSNNR